MAPSVAAGRQLLEASLSAILSDMQACISEPGRILYGWARDIVRRLLFSRGAGTGGEILSDAVKLARSGGEIPSDAVKLAGSGEEIPSDAVKLAGSGGEIPSDAVKFVGTGGDILSDAVKLAGAAEHDTAAAVYEYDDLNTDEDNCFYYEPDYCCYVPVDNFHDLGDYDKIDRSGLPPTSWVPYYHGYGSTIDMASYNARNLVELLAVRPWFRLGCTFVAFSDHCEHYRSSERGQARPHADYKGYLILNSEDRAISDHFSIRINVQERDNKIDDDVGEFSYTVDPYTCGYAEVCTIKTRRGRGMHLTFLPMHDAIQANVYVTLDLVSSGSICYVYGEITAWHQVYQDKHVVLFSHGEEAKAEVIDGKVPLSRNWAVVPIYLKPLLTIKVDLFVPADQDHDDHGRIISFHDDVNFFNLVDCEKIMYTEDNEKVKVKIAYR